MQTTKNLTVIAWCGCWNLGTNEHAEVRRLITEDSVLMVVGIDETVLDVVVPSPSSCADQVSYCGQTSSSFSLDLGLMGEIKPLMVWSIRNASLCTTITSPHSVGEIGRYGAPGRRNHHGALGERALLKSCQAWKNSRYPSSSRSFGIKRFFIQASSVRGPHGWCANCCASIGIAMDYLMEITNSVIDR